MKTIGSITSLIVVAIACAMTMSAQQAGVYGHYEVYDTDLFSREEYAARRNDVLAKMPTGSAMLLLSADGANRNGGVNYVYRQRDNLLYLSGVIEDNSALLLLKSPATIDGTLSNEILFVQRRDSTKEVWNGVVMGPAVATSVTGIRVALPIDRLRSVCDSIFGGLSVLYLDAPTPNQGTDPVTGIVSTNTGAFSNVRSKSPQLSMKKVDEILDAMRRLKRPAEIAMMQRAIDVTVNAHRETIKRAKDGMHEYELQAIMEGEFIRQGAEFPGYPSIVGSGKNTCVLHYESNRRLSKPGDLILMDCGSEYHGYTADITRTIPIGGKFSPEQRAIYNLVLEAQDSGIAACRAGYSFKKAHERAVSVVTRGLKQLGIIREDAQYKMYFMHGTSHYLGMNVHDVGDYKLPLEAGVVMTVEPGIYIPPNSKCDKKWWGIGVRIEDDLLVTDGDPINLSAKLEKRPEDIEKLMGR